MTRTPTLWRSTAQAALLGMAGAAAMFAAEMLLFPGMVRAADITVDSSCIKGCVTDLRACLADARQDFLTCSLEGGCGDLQVAARTACMADKTASICIEARAAVRDCLAPCRDGLRTETKVCENNAMSCLHNDCGLIDLPEQCRRVTVTAQ